MEELNRSIHHTQRNERSTSGQRTIAQRERERVRAEENERDILKSFVKKANTRRAGKHRENKTKTKSHDARMTAGERHQHYRTGDGTTISSARDMGKGMAS